jgi:hypothetical protein
MVAGETPVLLLSCRIEKLKVLQFESVSRGDFPNAPSRCLVKCM